MEPRAPFDYSKVFDPLEVALKHGAEVHSAGREHWFWALPLAIDALDAEWYGLVIARYTYKGGKDCIVIREKWMA